MSLQDNYPADWDKVRDGVEMTVAGIPFVLTYYKSTQAQIKFQASIQKFAATMSVEDATVEAMRTTLVDHIVLGWRSREETPGAVPTPYSKETLNRLLHEYVGLDVELMEAASNVAAFKKVQGEETEKKQ